VNCTRWKLDRTDRARACASVVFPTPGTSSISRWPFASRQASERRRTSSFPRIARASDFWISDSPERDRSGLSSVSRWTITCNHIVIHKQPRRNGSVEHHKGMKINIGLTEAHRAGVVGLLTPLLADEYVLYTKTRNYHWNVTGPHFHDLHKFFESQYEELDDTIDEIAEWIRSLGERSPGSLAEFLKSARLKEAAPLKISATQMIEDLVGGHESIIVQLRKDIKAADEEYEAADVADFLTGLLEDHEKMAWMLRSTAE
jgi:starvation-inducible DNA-binding protein